MLSYRQLIFGNFRTKPLLLFEGRTLNSKTLTRLSQGHTYFCRIVAVLSDLRIESVAWLAQAGGHRKKTPKPHRGLLSKKPKC